MVAAILICLSSAAVACAQMPTDFKAIWKDKMLSYGERYCHTGDQFYDAIRVYYQIAEYTGNAKWERCVETYIRSYRDGYLTNHKYGSMGHWIFPHGLMMHYQRTGDEKSKNAVLGLAQKAAFAYAPLDYTAASTSSREVAYNLEAKVLAEELGYKDDKRIKEMADQALGHYDQWFVSKTAPYLQPFMAALTAEALIMWYDKTKDPRVLPALKTGADWMWEHMWVPKQGYFKYMTGDDTPAADLNLLIAPLYGWLYKMTGDAKYRNMGDTIFEWGITTGYLESPKHFIQNYRWSFNYFVWRGDPVPGNRTAPK